MEVFLIYILTANVTMFIIDISTQERMQSATREWIFIRNGGNMCRNILKRICAFALIVATIFCLPNTVFAAESEGYGENNEPVIADALLDHQKVTLAANSQNNIYVDIGNIPRFNLEFNFFASCAGGDTGAVFIYIYNPDNELMSEELVMGPNTSLSYTIFWAPAGTWRIYVLPQHVKSSVVFEVVTYNS